MALSSDLKLQLPDQKDQCCKVVLNTFYQRQHLNQVKVRKGLSSQCWGSHGSAPSITQKGKDRGKNTHLTTSFSGKDLGREETKESKQKPLESETQMMLKLVLYDS